MQLIKQKNGWEPAVYMSCLHESKLSVCFSHRIYPIKTFDFSAHVPIRGQWIHGQPTSEVPAAGLLDGRGDHQKIGGTDYRITRLGNVPDCTYNTTVCLCRCQCLYKIGRL